MASNPKEPHICGAAGYGAIGDTCPACEADRAASPLPAEPPPTDVPWGERRADDPCSICCSPRWKHLHPDFRDAYGHDFKFTTPSAAEPPRMSNMKCWVWLEEIDLTLHTCLAATATPEAFDLPQVRANIDASRRAIERLKALLDYALKAAEPQKEE